MGTVVAASIVNVPPHYHDGDGRSSYLFQPLLHQQDGVTRIQRLVLQKKGRKLNHTYRVVRDLCREQKIDNFIFLDPSTLRRHESR